MRCSSKLMCYVYNVVIVRTKKETAMSHINHALVIDNFPNTFIAPSHVHGYGLFAKTPLLKGSILGFLDGQIMAWDLYDKLIEERNLSSILKEAFFMEWNCIAPDKLLVRPFRTKYSFINHSRFPNAQIEHFPLRVVALQDIDEGEELLIDYRREPLPEQYLQGHGKTFL